MKNKILLFISIASMFGCGRNPKQIKTQSDSFVYEHSAINPSEIQYEDDKGYVSEAVENSNKEFAIVYKILDMQNEMQAYQNSYLENKALYYQTQDDSYRIKANESILKEQKLYAQYKKMFP